MPLPAVIHCMSPGSDGAVISHAVAVFHGSGENICDGFDPAVRVPGKAREIILGNVIAEVIEQEEWIEVGGVAEAEGAAQVYARAFERWLGFDELLDRTNGHEGLLGEVGVKTIIAGYEAWLIVEREGSALHFSKSGALEPSEPPRMTRPRRIRSMAGVRHEIAPTTPSLRVAGTASPTTPF